MKDKVKVSLIQFAPQWFQPENNAQRMRDFAEKEAQKGAELIVFPETSNIGYITPLVAGEATSFAPGVSAVEFAAKYVKASEPIPGPTTELLGEVSSQYNVYIVAGMSQLHPVIPATIYNSAVLIGPSGVVGVHHKVNTALHEKDLFYPGTTLDVYRTDLGNIGMLVCYDGRFPENARVLALKGAEIICSVWAIPNLGKLINVHNLKYRAYTRAQENGCYFLACNRTGTEGDKVYMGHSAIAEPNGDIIAYADSDKEEVITAELYNEEVVKYRVSFTIFRDRRPDLYSLITAPPS